MQRHDVKASSMSSDGAAITFENVDPVQTPNTDPGKSFGGRPVGATNQKRKLSAMALIATANEIVLQYKKEKNSVKRVNKRMKKGHLSELIEKAKEKNNLPADAVITEMQICQGLKRNVPITVNCISVITASAGRLPRCKFVKD